MILGNKNIYISYYNNTSAIFCTTLNFKWFSVHINIDKLSIFQCLILRKPEQIMKALATLLTDTEDLLSKLFQA